MKNVMVISLFVTCLLFLNFKANGQGFFDREELIEQGMLQKKFRLSEVDSFLLELTPTMYWITAKIEMRGDFFNCYTEKEQDYYENWFEGNAFVIDSYGGLLTNAHVVNPTNLLSKTLTSIRPRPFLNGSTWGIEIRRVDSIHITYSVIDNSGTIYKSSLPLEAKWTPAIFPAPFLLFVEMLTPLSYDKSDQVTLVGFNKAVDLAFLTIPEKTRNHVRFSDSSELSVGEEVYNLSFRQRRVGDMLLPQLEIRYGKIEDLCSPYIISGREHLSTVVKMYSDPGKSGSMFVSAKTGRLVGVSVGYLKDTPVTCIVPIDHVRDFYRYVFTRGRGEPPEFSCQTCCD